MRTPAPRRALTLCAAFTLLALTGCTDPDPVATPDPIESWTAEEEAQAVQDAEQAVRDYWRVSVECLADPPNTDPSCFDEVSYGDRLTSDQTALADAQEAGLRYVGEVTYTRTDRVVSVDLSIGPDKEVHLAVCTNREDYDVLRSDGTSVIPPDTPRHVQSIYVVRKHTSQWQVADIQKDPEGTEC